ncbi:DNase I-like protein [Lentithecium fluviatile CBS 122367]|uniref:DNase I-like protein n=1 Tax=Lentithecium fluviatile CBS 122367 TaxID=1168545 RepID=A0A6G1IT39_9PLEO|nr:DNase I-like protein [Lentithecium fluviatile CBS 122367]
MLELYLVSFNCARNLVNPESLAPSFFQGLPKGASVPDVIAISLQEVAPIAYSFLGGSYLKPYFDRVSTAVHLAVDLHSHGSEELEHIATRSLGMTALMIFAKPQVAERIKWIQSAGAGVGFWNMGNKGAIAMRVGISRPDHDSILKLSFTAAHLAPMECNIDARNEDWKNLVHNMVFLNDDDSAYTLTEQAPLLSSSEPPAENDGLFSPGSHLFFAGDLNYRTHDNPPLPDTHESYPSGTSREAFSHWLKKDQLTREKEANRTLHGLQEMPIEFPPTYKLSIKKNSKSHKRSSSDTEVQWEWAKHRYPSWCDRILFLPNRTVEPQVYTALPVQATSDHRPVALSLCVDNRPLSREADDGGSSAPFPINPNWRARRDAARRWEVVVGVLSYLALTKKGNAIILAAAGMAFASWYLAAWLKR